MASNPTTQHDGMSRNEREALDAARAANRSLLRVRTGLKAGTDFPATRKAPIKVVN
jgi:hypothetical protein